MTLSIYYVVQVSRDDKIIEKKEFFDYHEAQDYCDFVEEKFGTMYTIEFEVVPVRDN